MAWMTAIPLVGKVVEGLVDLVDQSITDKDKAQEIKSTLTQVMLSSDLTRFTEQIQAQMNIIIAEAKGGWLQRNWRPGLMALFGLIIANNYVLYPYLSLIWPQAPMLQLPPEMWELLKLGVGGYVVGRSVEKGIETWKRGRGE